MAHKKEFVPKLFVFFNYAAIYIYSRSFFFSQNIPRRLFGFLGCPDNHLVVVLEGFQPGLNVRCRVLEGLFVFDADAGIGIGRKDEKL